MAVVDKVLSSVGDGGAVGGDGGMGGWAVVGGTALMVNVVDHQSEKSGALATLGAARHAAANAVNLLS